MQHLCSRPRTPERQPDLFQTNQPPAPDMAPGWSALPDRTRHVLTGLMTRLLIAHASGAAPASGSDADER